METQVGLARLLVDHRLGTKIGHVDALSRHVGAFILEIILDIKVSDPKKRRILH
jgi:hypothetical protein